MPRLRVQVRLQRMVTPPRRRLAVTPELTIEQAGAVIITGHGGGRRVLLVTARKNPAHWLFPKGHVEAGESPEDAALREAEEEAGVRGRILEPAGSLTFELGYESVRVHYFLVSTSDKGRPEKGRELAWCTFEQALEQLTFNDTRGLLRRVWRTLDAR
jgi:8-oxo-dGTP pyrophosphatase MutT (NUDIX family)